MGINLFLGFLPWILVDFISGQDWNLFQGQMALLLLFILSVGVEYRGLQKRFILSYTSVLFLGFLFVISLTSFYPWFLEHIKMLSYLTLTSVSLMSLIFDAPFTLQYAKEKTPDTLWETPLFLKINKILTTVWTVLFFMNIFYPWRFFLLIGIVMNVFFPSWYAERCRPKS